MPPTPASPVPPRLAPDAEPTSVAPSLRRDAPPRRTYRIYDSATDELLGHFSAARDDEVRDAVGRSADAVSAWAATPMPRRAAVLRDWAASLRAEIAELAASLTAETGALRRDARSQVEDGIDAIERYAAVGEVRREPLPSGGVDGEVVQRVPRGVVAVLLPWRDPIALACAQVAACLVSGNTVIVKPSGRAPFSVTRALRRIVAPTDVVILLHGGAETGAALSAADEVDLVLHTGSVETGQTIAAACVARLGTAIVERGGKGAVIVDRDADPDATAAYASVMAFSHGGQLCGSVDRLLVHDAVHERFIRALLARTEQIRVGPGTDARSTLGPLIDARQRATVHGHVTAAVAEGAHARTGGALPHGPGCFYPPTVLDDVRPTMAVWSQKTYGPVVAVLPFDHFGDALRTAAEGGQPGATTLFTGDPEHRERAARELDGAVIDGDDGPLTAGNAGSRLRRSATGLGLGAELLDELTRWQVTRGHRTV